MRKIQFIVVMLFMVVQSAMSQQIVADAPQQVVVGQQFRLVYTVKANGASDFKLSGQMPSEIKVLMGPTYASRMSVSDINGRVTQESSVTYTYIVVAEKAGSFTLPKATATAGGKRLTSNAVKITVSDKTNDSSGQSKAVASGPEGFFTVVASKKRVYEQEAILLTYKLYSQIITDRRSNVPKVRALEYQIPNTSGFFLQAVDDAHEASYKLEEYKGQKYLTVVWNQFIVYPQTTGKLHVPEITYKAEAIHKVDVDDFEAFFNSGSNYVVEKIQLTAPSIDIQVDALPQRPADFSGGVGQFKVSAEIDKTTLKVNEPVTLRLKISGKGNLKLLKEPTVRFPQDFDAYDAKMNDSTRLTTSGMEGYVVYDYLAVPRNPGKYDIPTVEFVYYNPEKKQYQTLKTKSFQLTVEPGDGSSTTVQHYGTQEEIQMLGSDIRFIKQGRSRLHNADDFFFGSAAYWGMMFVIVVLFVVLFVVFRKQMRENADVVKSKGKKANKVATKRLKKAATLMRDNKPNEFYDETLHALWGYMSDKLNMAVEQLTHDNITEKLQACQVDNATISQFVEAIDECEFERYAPGDPKGNMNKVYEKAMTAIERIEDMMKTSHARFPKATMLLVLSALTWLLSFQSSVAQTKNEADSCYVNGYYQQAISLYEQLLQGGVDANLYYNLGNAYYRTENITRAIINYERALLLSPGDGDIRFNLQMARSKTVDKIVPESEMFFVTWYHSLVSMTSVDGWARFALVMLVLALVSLLAYLFGRQLWLRKTTFFGGILMLLLFLLSNLFAWQQKKVLVHRDGAIITDATVTVKSTPDNTGTDLFVLHEGTKVKVEDAIKGWQKIKLPDGKEGWIGSSQLEII